MRKNPNKDILERLRKATGPAAKLEEISRFAMERRALGHRLTFRQAVAAHAIENGIEKDSRRALNLVNKIYDELQINPHTTQMRELLISGDITPFTFLVREIILDALQQGFSQMDWSGDLIAISEPAESGTATKPLYPRNTEAKMRETAEAAEPYYTTLEWGEKIIRTRKFSHGFIMTYETARMSSINAMSRHFAIATKNYAYKRQAYLMNVIVNGEKPTDKKGVIIDETIATIGVYDKTKNFQYKDHLRMCLRMSKVGGVPSALITSENNCIDVLMLDEFKKPVQGTPEMTAVMKTALPRQMNIYEFPLSGEDQYLVTVNPTAAIGQVMVHAPLLEDDKLITQQKIRVVYTEAYGLYTLLRTARLRLDQDNNFVDAEFGWPEWFTTETFVDDQE